MYWYCDIISMFIWKRPINTVTYIFCMFICKFNMLGNTRILFLLQLPGIFCIYMHLDFSISIQFSNAVVTVRNESRNILEYLMYFCSRYVMWQAFYSLSHPYILVSIFGTAFFDFCSSFLVSVMFYILAF